MSYILDAEPTINLPVKAENHVIAEFLSNYTYGLKWNTLYNSEGNCITVGNCTKIDYDNAEFVLNVTDDGIYIGGCDYSATMRGFLTFLEKIRYSPEKDFFYIENCCVYENAMLSFRCVHLCIFPETKLEFLKKCVRTCAISKYSHIILEFWGMLKYDCMKEMSWPFAYSKEEIRNIAEEANALGIEIIPMFNHLGHASGSRGANGNHVVLDQNPRYEYMFEEYGWVWNYKRADVYELLREIRKELTEVCGAGNYFHIGCDEAYSVGSNAESATLAVEYINKISNEMKEKGRRLIMWGDMLLSKNDFKDYEVNSNKEISDIMIKNLDKSILIADWQYSCHDETWKTSLKLKESGFDVVCCPWDNKQNINEAIETVNSNKLYGIIQTTWHTLFRGFSEMIYGGLASYGTDIEIHDEVHRHYCASVARKAMPSHGEYEKCGWPEKWARK